MYNPHDYNIKNETVSEMRREISRAIQKHGRENTPLSDGRTRGFKLAVLMEEVGEVAKAMNEYELGNIGPEELISQLKKELGQVAAVSSMWLECETNIGG